MVCFFSDGSFVFVCLAGYCIQCGLVCFFSDGSFVFIDSFFVSIDVVAVVGNLVGYSFDSIMYCGKAFVGICLVSIDSFFVGIDVFAVCFERRHDTIAYAFCDFFKVFIQTADGIVKSIVGFGLFFQFFSIFIDSFFVGIDGFFVSIDSFFVSIDVVAVVGNLVGYSFDSIMYCGKAFVGICLVSIDSFFVGIDVFAVCFERRHDTIAYAFCDFFKVFIQTADGIVKSIVGFGLFFQFFSIFIDSFFDVGNFCSGSFGFACGSLSIACCSFCSFYFGIDVLFGFFGRLFGFIGGVDGVVGLSVGFIQ